MLKLTNYLSKIARSLSLPLLMARVAADDVNATFAADDFAILTNSFDAGSNFHGIQFPYSGVRIVPKRVSISDYEENHQGPCGAVINKKYLKPQKMLAHFFPFFSFGEPTRPSERSILRANSPSACRMDVSRSLEPSLSGKRRYAATWICSAL